MDKKSVWTWMLGPLITIIVILGGFMASWSVAKASIIRIQEDQAKIEQRLTENEKKDQADEIQAARDNEVLQQIKKTVEEIKKAIEDIRDKNK